MNPTETQTAREMGDMGYTKKDIETYLDERAAKRDEDRAMADNDNDEGGDWGDDE